MKWEQERIVNEKLVKRIGLFNSLCTESVAAKSKTLLPSLKKSRQATTRMSKRRIRRNYETEFQVIDPTLFERKRAKTTKRSKKRAHTSEKTNTDEAKTLDIAKVCKIPEDRTVVHQSSKVMAGGHYEIEIAKTDKSMFIAAVNKNKHSENFTIELELSKGEEILKEFNNDYSLIEQNLQIMSRRLVLLNPKIVEKPRMKTKNRSKNSSHKKLDKTARATQSQPVLPSDLDKENQPSNEIENPDNPASVPDVDKENTEKQSVELPQTPLEPIADTPACNEPN